MKKKIISLVLVCAMCFCSASIVFADDEKTTNDTLEKIAEEQLKDAIVEKIDSLDATDVTNAVGDIIDSLIKKADEENGEEQAATGSEEEKPLSQQPVLQVVLKVVKGLWKVIKSLFGIIIKLISALANKEK